MEHLKDIRSFIHIHVLMFFMRIQIKWTKIKIFFLRGRRLALKNEIDKILEKERKK